MEETIVSSDSHVIEVPDLWEKGMPPPFKERAPKAFFDEKRDAWMFGSPEVQIQAVGGLFMAGQQPENLEKFRRAGFAVARPGGWDPLERHERHGHRRRRRRSALSELGAGPVLRRGCRRCKRPCSAPTTTGSSSTAKKCPIGLFGIALISMYNIDHAIAEMERCKKAGIVGTMIWQVPHPSLPFTSEHYERFWAASQDLDLPVHLHILTGFGDSMHRQTAPRHRNATASASQQTREIEDALFELIFHGVLERYPKLKIVSVENEVGWMPFWLGQCDKGFKRHRHSEKVPDEQAAERILCRADLRDFFQRPGRRQAVFLVGRRQLHVVQRLPAPEFDLAEFPRRDRRATWPICRRRTARSCSIPTCASFIN